MTIGERISDLLRQVRQRPVGEVKDYLAEHNRLWALINEIDADAGTGLQIGRVVTWPAADGYAVYFVIGLQPRTVTLKHVPIGDAWREPLVPITGKVNRSIVEKRIAQMDAMNKLFSKGA